MLLLPLEEWKHVSLAFHFQVISPSERLGVAMRGPETSLDDFYSFTACCLTTESAPISVMSEIEASDHLAIKNVLSRYCEALDLKSFHLLEKVFVPEAAADYPFNSDLKGVDAISTAIQNRCVHAVMEDSLIKTQS
jgi:hypothetical protein